jgi:hypothetical protein
MLAKSSSSPMANLDLRYPHDVPGILFRGLERYFGWPNQQSYASEPEKPKSLTPIDILNFYCIDSNTPFACLASYSLLGPELAWLNVQNSHICAADTIEQILFRRASPSPSVCPYDYWNLEYCSRASFIIQDSLSLEDNSWSGFTILDYLNEDDDPWCSFAMRDGNLNLEVDLKCSLTIRDEYSNLEYCPRNSLERYLEHFWSSFSIFDIQKGSPPRDVVDSTTAGDSHSRGLHTMSYPETWGPTDFDSDSPSWAYQSIVSLSNLNSYLNYLSLDLLFPADDPIICLNCDKIKDDSPDDMSNLLSRSRRLKLLSFIGFGVLTLVVLILRSGFTWSGIGSRFTHWGQSRSTKMSDDTFSTRRAIKWEVERPWASWRTRIRRIGFIFRVSCLPFILVCICGTAALVIDLFQRLTLVRWHLSKLTCSPNSHIPPTPFSGTVTWIATSTLFPRSSFL